MNTESEIEWPGCPDCGQARLTVCPVCHSPADNLERGHAAPHEPIRDSRTSETSELPEDSEVEWVLCSTCDEPFRPTFYRFCPRCGYDFGRGLQPESPVAPEINDRVILVFAILAALGIALLAYFGWVLK